MKNLTISVIVAAALATSLPAKVSADGKDVAIGVILGAIGQKVVSESKKKSQGATRSTSSTRSTAAKKYSPPSLNSKFTSDERVQIQSSLAALGYNVGTIDGVLGPNSRRVIGQFQASRGEAATGQMTRPQYVALLSSVPGAAPIFTRRELNAEEVRLLQQGLQQLGYYRGSIDGAKGPGTRGALTAFLAQNGLNPVQTTPVQGLVMARSVAQLPTPMYLQQESGMQVAGGSQQQPFPTQPQTFGTQQPTVPVGLNPQAQQNTLFGAPAQPGLAQPQAGMGQPQGSQPANNLFGVPQPQQPGVAQGGAIQQQVPTGQQDLFSPNATQQQAPQPALAPTQPQGLFATGAQAPAPQQVAPPMQQSTLDIFSAPSSATAASGQANLIVQEQGQAATSTQQQPNLFQAPASN